jgi:hypothetical protein
MPLGRTSIGLLFGIVVLLLAMRGIAVGQPSDTDPPLVSKDAFIHSFQGNFGTISLPGCGLHMDMLFDPFLLQKFVQDRPCYERMLQAHMDRGDNVVVVSPKSGYHGHNDLDLWHQPDVIAAFLRDVRRHRNNRGEPIRPIMFMAGDGHIDNMKTAGAFEHWQRDIDALAAAAAPYIDSTATCWECRDGQSFVDAATYIRMARYVAEKFPRAVHGPHLAAQVVSWSGPPEANDPNHGDPIASWVNARREGWADVLYYQFDTGRPYLSPESLPPDPASKQRGAMQRWWEVAVRLGDDPWSRATSLAAHPNGDHFGWPVQVPIVAFEFIYDTYWKRDPKATEAYAVEWCKQALAIGGWGCGSASYRRPQ